MRNLIILFFILPLFLKAQINTYNLDLINRFTLGPCFTVAGNNQILIAGAGSTILFYDVSDIDNIKLFHSISTNYPVYKVEIRDSILFVQAQIETLIIDISDLQNIFIVSKTSGLFYSEKMIVHGNFIFLPDARSGVGILDISDLENPKALQQIDKVGYTSDCAMIEDYLYVVERGSSPDRPGGLRIFRFSNNKFYFSKSIPLENAAEVFIEDNKLFIVANHYTMDLQPLRSTFMIYDIQDRLNPSLVNSIGLPDLASELIVKDNIAYVAVDYDGIAMIKLSDAELNVRLLGPRRRCRDFELVGNKLYCASNDIEVVEIINMNTFNIYKVEILGLAYADIEIFENELIVANQSLIRTLDISDPYNLAEKEKIIINAELFAKDSNTLVIGGFFDFALLDLSTKSIVGQWTNGLGCFISRGVTEYFIENDIVYVVEPGVGIRIYDLSNISDIQFRSAYDLSYDFEITFYVSNKYIFYGSRDNGLIIIDATDIDNPTFERQLFPDQYIRGLASSQNALYILTDSMDKNNPADNIIKFYILNLEDLSYADYEPFGADTIDLDYGYIANDLTIHDNKLYLSAFNKLISYNIDDEWNPILDGLYYSSSSNFIGIREFEKKDDYIFSANWLGGINVYKISTELTDIDNNLNNPINIFSLSQNYPNPFNPSTLIKYSIPKQSNVTLKVFDVLGSEVTTLVNKEQSQGNYEIEFDALTSSPTGSELTSGIYFYRLRAGDYVETRKMILLK